jgi:hypothetical protein
MLETHSQARYLIPSTTVASLFFDQMLKPLYEREWNPFAIVTTSAF